MLEACKPQAWATSLCPDLKQRAVRTCLSSLPFKMGQFDTAVLLTLLCQKAHLLYVPYSLSYACDCCPWAWAACREGHTLVRHLAPAWPYSTKSRRLQLFHTIPWCAPASSSEGSACPGRIRGMDTWLISVLGYECPSERCQHHSARFASPQSAPLRSAEPLAQSSLVLPIPCSLYALNCLVFLFSFPASPHFFFLRDFSLPLPFRLPVSPPSRHFRQQEFRDIACSYILH